MSIAPKPYKPTYINSMGDTIHSRIIYASRQELLGRVLVEVRARQKRQALRNVSLSALAFLPSVTGLAYAGGYLYESMAKNGFLEFSSLLVSDTRLAMEFAGDYASSLAESLPAAEIAAFLAVGLASSYFIWIIITNISILRHGNSGTVAA